MKTSMNNAALKKHLKKTLPIAATAALDAGKFIRSKFGKFRQLTLKADTSLVTEVDQKSEQIVLKHLHKAFPKDHIKAEETGESNTSQKSSFRWHIDPLDGTTNFVHKFPFFCVSIGLEFEDGLPCLGVIYNPMTDELYLGASGLGVTRNKKPIQVSRTKRLSDGLLSTGFSMRRDHFFRREIATLERMAGASHSLRRTGSAALDITHVASGQFDGFWERHLKTWDVCAALALLTEAGGKFSTYSGKPYRLGDEELVVSNGALHEAMVKNLR
jgi:myo-inositol-1(or 4)-monophosphatase